MVRDRKALAELQGDILLHYTGMETDLIFNRGIDLPGFASFPLLKTAEGREILLDYYRKLIDLGRRADIGVFLDSATWMASRDRGAAIGYGRDELKELNTAAIGIMAQVRYEHADHLVVLSAQTGPRGDAYSPGKGMSADEATEYHSEQIGALAESEAELVSAFTLGYPEEATGVVRAANRFNMPVAISFTVEADGRLPDGTLLGDAITTVDEATNGSALYYLINCAHPDHFNGTLTHEPWIRRLRGVVVNASRRSHAELDNSTELDAGDPDELGGQLGELRRRFSHFNIFGGCCGTDLRHLERIANSVKAAAAACYTP
jgi:homocysteine S-methyltransferase